MTSNLPLKVEISEPALSGGRVDHCCPAQHVSSQLGWLSPPAFPGEMSPGVVASPAVGLRRRCRCYLLGTLLMARSGRRTRTVRIADKLTLCPSREYSIMLRGKEERGQDVGGSVLGHQGAGGCPGLGCRCLCALGVIAQAGKTHPHHVCSLSCVVMLSGGI